MIVSIEVPPDGQLEGDCVLCRQNTQDANAGFAYAQVVVYGGLDAYGQGIRTPYDMTACRERPSGPDAVEFPPRDLPVHTTDGSVTRAYPRLLLTIDGSQHICGPDPLPVTGTYGLTECLCLLFVGDQAGSRHRGPRTVRSERRAALRRPDAMAG